MIKTKSSENVEKYIEFTKKLKMLVDLNDHEYDKYISKLDELWKKMSSTERYLAVINLKDY